MSVGPVLARAHEIYIYLLSLLHAIAAVVAEYNTVSGNIIQPFAHNSSGTCISLPKGPVGRARANTARLQPLVCSFHGDIHCNHAPS